MDRQETKIQREKLSKSIENNVFRRFIAGKFL